jgi:serine/threonine-protein kinase RIO1
MAKQTCLIIESERYMIDYKMAVEKLNNGLDYFGNGECLNVHLYFVSVYLMIDIDVVGTDFEMSYDEEMDEISEETLKNYVEKAIKTILKELKEEMVKEILK